MENLILEKFEKFEIKNLHSLTGKGGGDFYYTGGVCDNGTREDFCVNNIMFYNNGDGTYSR